jgi:hypothetical protein
VQLGVACGFNTFQHLLDQVDAPARPIELVTQELIGGASGRAKTAVHAFAQNRFGFLAVDGVLVFGGEVGLHREVY